MFIKDLKKKEKKANIWLFLKFITIYVIIVENVQSKKY